MKQSQFKLIFESQGSYMGNQKIVNIASFPLQVPNQKIKFITVISNYLPLFKRLDILYIVFSM